MGDSATETYAFDTVIQRRLAIHTSGSQSALQSPFWYWKMSLGVVPSTVLGEHIALASDKDQRYRGVSASAGICWNLKQQWASSLPCCISRISTFSSVFYVPPERTRSPQHWGAVVLNLGLRSFWVLKWCLEQPNGNHIKSTLYL